MEKPTAKGTADDSAPNVTNYFEAALEASAGDRREELADCPLVSVCGIACREAIDAARSLRRQIVDTFGDHSYEEQSLLQVVRELCYVIYFG